MMMVEDRSKVIWIMKKTLKQMVGEGMVGKGKNTLGLFNLDQQMFQHFLKSPPSSSFSGEQSRCSLCQGQPTPGDHYEDGANAALDKGDYCDDDDDDDTNYDKNHSDNGHDGYDNEDSVNDDDEDDDDDDNYLMFL